MGLWELLPANDTGLFLGTIGIDKLLPGSEPTNFYTIRDDAVKKDIWVSEETSSVPMIRGTRFHPLGVRRFSMGSSLITPSMSMNLQRPRRAAMFRAIVAG